MNKYFRGANFKGIIGEPKDLPLEILSLASSDTDKGDMKCVEIIMTSDVRGILDGISDEEMAKSIMETRLICGLEILRRENKIKVVGELSFNPSIQFSIIKNL